MKSPERDFAWTECKVQLGQLGQLYAEAKMLSVGRLGNHNYNYII